MTALKKLIRADVTACAEKIANDQALRQELVHTLRDVTAAARARRASAVPRGSSERALQQAALSLLRRLERGLETVEPRPRRWRRTALVGTLAGVGALGLAVAAKATLGAR